MFAECCARVLSSSILVTISIFFALAPGASAYESLDIGSPSIPGGSSAVADGYDLTGSGADIGGAKDQFQFTYQQESGDFDFSVRLADLTIPDSYAKAGLMVREALTNSARFAAVFASSVQLGCFFESRATAATAATLSAPALKFPANYPWAWLRLTRSGDDFTGYGSFDGNAWQLLGTVNMALPVDLLFGMTVTSGNTNALATAKFREIGPVQDPTTFTYIPTRESIGPSNRRTGLIFSEIMYHPKERADGKNLAFVELYNGESIFADLTGWKITGGIDFSFPDGFRLEAGQFAVIAADPIAIQSVYGITGVLGPYQKNLSQKKDTLTLRNQSSAVRAELTYSSQPPWPVSADGAGHSLVCLKPSYGEDDVRAWGPSQLIGGSPGFDDPIVPHSWAGVVINEFLATPKGADSEFVELYNGSNTAVDLSGCFLTDSTGTNKFAIPNGTQLEARSWISFAPEQLGFTLSPAGGAIYLVSADQSRVLDAVRYRAQEEGVSMGRSPDASPTFRRVSNPTPGRANSPRKPEDVVINEIMYKPITDNPDDEYIELYNSSANAVDLSGWQFSDGIDFSFSQGVSIPSHGYLVVARNIDRLLTNYVQLNRANTVGNFTGKLSGSGEHVALAKPGVTNSEFITVSEVIYGTGGRWPELASGGGSSLELTDARGDLSLASNWAASDETQKATWTSYEVTGTLNLANQTYAATKCFITCQGEGEYLVDDLEVLRSGTNILNNPGFESGQTGWNFYGTHLPSTIDSGNAFSGNNCLHVRSVEVGDEGPNSIRGSLSATIAANSQVTLRAKVRWLSGWPEILFRVRGNGIELPMTLNVPSNLGTPGLPNSRRVENAGPAISDVTHFPPVPAANQPVVVTARVSDPDALSAVELIYRLDPATSTTSLQMSDDGTGGDLLAGDGIYSATLPGQASGVVAFRVQARDAAAVSAATTFPDGTRECLIRWGDPAPLGSFAHYHLWSTAASASDITSKPGLDRRYRDCTIVYDTRVIYNAGWRNKGSPFHGGTGSYSTGFSDDDLFLGSGRHVFRSTGNGGNEGTQMADDVAYWMAGQMGVPFNHSRYMRVYRNGGLQYPISYDMEAPDRSIAQDWFGGGGLDDSLYKITGWFEYDDNNGNGASSVSWATFQKKPSSAPPYKLAAYRFNWNIHPGGRTANNYSLIFNLVAGANATDKITQLMNVGDMEEWMRVFAHRRVIGDWDSWSYRTGQNMYLYAPLGERARLMSWDMDFVLGLGDAATANQLFSAGEDSVIAALFNVPTYRRMLWRAYQDAVNGPLQKAASDAQFDARRSALVKNGVSSTAPTSLKSYVSARRTFLQNQIKAADAAAFSIATQDFTTATPTATLTGLAPFGVASIEINGIPYPATWTTATNWSIKVPLGAATNILQIAGKDLRGNVYPGAGGQVTVTYTGAVPQAQDWVVINEIMYNPPLNNSEFIEIFNTHPTSAFDLSGFQLKGADFTFANGTFIQPNGYLLVVKDRASFAAAYGATIPVAGQYAGSLQHNGETLRLVKPGATPSEDLLIDEVHYQNILPWPAEADGLGPCLQLIDASQDNWPAGNWGVTAIDDVNRATPGRANASRALVEPYPSLTINEVLPNNQTGAADSNGERDPWIEIYNFGSSAVDLESLFLSDNPLNPGQWQFPAGTVLGPSEFLLVWADGQEDQSLPGEPHTNFRLDPASGFVELSRIQLGAPVAIEYLYYTNTAPDQSFGSLPDGSRRTRHLLAIPSPGGPNNPASINPPVFINEWMSSNTGLISDPANARFEDWFELYNAGTNAVDLANFFLSDDPDVPAMFRISESHTIPAHGFMLVWADGLTTQNVPGALELHVNFKLSRLGETLTLSNPNEGLVDSVLYAAQADGASDGRYPDGSQNIYPFATSTPLAPNMLSAGNGPQFNQVTLSGSQLTLAWTTVPNGVYQLEFKDDLGQLTWTSLNQAMNAPGQTLSITVDIGQSPHRFFRIVRAN